MRRCSWRKTSRLRTRASKRPRQVAASAYALVLTGCLVRALWALAAVLSQSDPPLLALSSSFFPKSFVYSRKCSSLFDFFHDQLGQLSSAFLSSILHFLLQTILLLTVVWFASTTTVSRPFYLVRVEMWAWHWARHSVADVSFLTESARARAKGRAIDAVANSLFMIIWTTMSAPGDSQAALHAS